MKKFVVAVLGFILVAGVSGCGANADSLVLDQIQGINDLADAMEKGDSAKAESAKKKIEEADKKLQDLKLSDDEKKKLFEKHKTEYENAVKKLFAAAFANKLQDFKMPDIKLGNEPKK